MVLCAVLGPDALQSPWKQYSGAAWSGGGPEAGALQAAGCGGGAAAAKGVGVSCCGDSGAAGTSPGRSGGRSGARSRGPSARP